VPDARVQQGRNFALPEEVKAVAHSATLRPHHSATSLPHGMTDATALTQWEETEPFLGAPLPTPRILVTGGFSTYFREVIQIPERTTTSKLSMRRGRMPWFPRSASRGTHDSGREYSECLNAFPSLKKDVGYGNTFVFIGATYLIRHIIKIRTVSMATLRPLSIK
jgi:hypothetical protein